MLPLVERHCCLNTRPAGLKLSSGSSSQGPKQPAGKTRSLPSNDLAGQDFMLSGHWSTLWRKGEHTSLISQTHNANYHGSLHFQTMCVNMRTHKDVLFGEQSKN